MQVASNKKLKYYIKDNYVRKIFVLSLFSQRDNPVEALLLVYIFQESALSSKFTKSSQLGALKLESDPTYNLGQPLTLSEGYNENPWCGLVIMYL